MPCYLLGKSSWGTLAHLGERTTEDRKVRGSSPRSPKLFSFSTMFEQPIFLDSHSASREESIGGFTAEIGRFLETSQDIDHDDEQRTEERRKRRELIKSYATKRKSIAAHFFHSASENSEIYIHWNGTFANAMNTIHSQNNTVREFITTWVSLFRTEDQN